MNLMFVQTHTVDLRRSRWDETSSDPDKGVFNFMEKHYVPTRPTGVKREHHLTWTRYDPTNGYRELSMARANGYSPVLPSQKLYFPEGAFINAAGYWQFGDLILTACPRELYLERRRDAVEQGAAGKDAAAKQFEATAAAAGAGLERL